MDRYDVAVIGGGIAGGSIGYELAADRSVCVLEMESTLAFHTTGRSAATFLETYGGPEIRALTTASRDFLTNPPEPFDRPLMTPLGLLWLAPADRVDALREMHDEVRALVPDIELLTPDAAVRINPTVRRDWVALAMTEPGGMDLDVHALHQGFGQGVGWAHDRLRLKGGGSKIGQHAQVGLHAARHPRRYRCMSS